jgi:hypothetical protein
MPPLFEGAPYVMTSFLGRGNCGLQYSKLSGIGSWRELVEIRINSYLAENTNKVGSAKKYHRMLASFMAVHRSIPNVQTWGGGGAQQAKLWSEARIEAPRPTGCQDWQRQFNFRFKKGKDSRRSEKRLQRSVNRLG